MNQWKNIKIWVHDGIPFFTLIYYSHCYQVTGEFDVERFLFTTHGFGYFLCVVPWNGQVVGFGLLTTGLIDLILAFVLSCFTF